MTQSIGYPVDTLVTIVEKVSGGARGAGPRFRFITSEGSYLTEPGAEQVKELRGGESGHARLMVAGDRVVAWVWVDRP